MQVTTVAHIVMSWLSINMAVALMLSFIKKPDGDEDDIDLDRACGRRGLHSHHHPVFDDHGAGL